MILLFSSVMLVFQVMNLCKSRGIGITQNKIFIDIRPVHFQDLISHSPYCLLCSFYVSLICSRHDLSTILRTLNLKRYSCLVQLSIFNSAL